MTKVFYPVILEPCEGGVGVMVPDLPGCFSGGDDRADALRQTAAAIALWAEETLKAGGEVPAPSRREDIRARDFTEDAAARVEMVAVQLASHSVPVTFTIDRVLLAEVDAAAKARGVSRSAFLAQGARMVLRNGDEPRAKSGASGRATGRARHA